MHLADFDYHLPPHLIAQEPARPRDSARLLVVWRGEERLEHRIFRDLPRYLQPGDVLVVNDTRVMPVRVRGRRESGGRVDALLVRPQPGNEQVWEALLRPSSRVRPGTRLVFAEGVLEATAGDRTPSGTRLLHLEYHGELRRVLEEVGDVPLPPYIRTRVDPTDYQTVYARRDGAVAAPTAGLHFTPGLLEELRQRGVAVVALTLHVGPGTFRPVETDDVRAHQMEAEYYEVSPDVAQAIAAARGHGGRVVVVGTTGVRALESAAREDGTVDATRGWTRLFITPGFTFRVTDALITNFHLPRSTPLLLACAFAGRERILAAYSEAVRQGYRFYSFGDAMLIL